MGYSKRVPEMSKQLKDLLAHVMKHGDTEVMFETVTDAKRARYTVYNVFSLFFGQLISNNGYGYKVTLKGKSLFITLRKEKVNAKKD
jgi:hypothetical protein